MWSLVSQLREAAKLLEAFFCFEALLMETPCDSNRTKTKSSNQIKNRKNFLENYVSKGLFFLILILWGIFQKKVQTVKKIDRLTAFLKLFFNHFFDFIKDFWIFKSDCWNGDVNRSCCLPLFSFDLPHNRGKYLQFLRKCLFCAWTKSIEFIVPISGCSDFIFSEI